MVALNSTVTTLPLHINLNHLANWKFSLLASLDEGAKQNARTAAQGMSPLKGEHHVTNYFRWICPWRW
jgi:hypothetical protein